ncbi:hypothetical protein ABB02_01943 [Clostridiaceae bacterium JG1575]|nr:hypothetical protein ABB02_01943 [Clostridiaceae bacterium JG1575]
MEDRVETSLLMDYYGGLLTDKQQSVMALYFYEDFSLKEIADLNGTSRQATHDLIRRTIHQLTRYEETLGLKAQSESQEQAKKHLLDELERRGQLDWTLLQYLDAL